MDLNSFFDALEEVANRLYRKKDPLENLRQILSKIGDQV
jgi:hypothetical protein